MRKLSISSAIFSFLLIFVISTSGCKGVDKNLNGT
jgi:hypothetical protein